MTKTFGFFAGIVATMFSAWVVRQLAIFAFVGCWCGRGAGFPLSARRMTSLCALLGHKLAAGSVFGVARLGCSEFFTATALIGIPVAMLPVWIWRQAFRFPISSEQDQQTFIEFLCR